MKQGYEIFAHLQLIYCMLLSKLLICRGAPMSEPAETAHTITRTIVRTAGIAALRASCACGDLRHDTPRFSAPGRRKQERLIREHLADAVAAEALAMAMTIEYGGPAGGGMDDGKVLLP